MTVVNLKASKEGFTEEIQMCREQIQVARAARSEVVESISEAKTGIKEARERITAIKAELEGC